MSNHQSLFREAKLRFRRISIGSSICNDPFLTHQDGTWEQHHNNITTSWQSTALKLKNTTKILLLNEEGNYQEVCKGNDVIWYYYRKLKLKKKRSWGPDEFSFHPVGPRLDAIGIHGELLFVCFNDMISKDPVLQQLTPHRSKNHLKSNRALQSKELSTQPQIFPTAAQQSSLAWTYLSFLKGLQELDRQDVFAHLSGIIWWNDIKRQTSAATWNDSWGVCIAIMSGYHASNNLRESMTNHHWPS